MTDMIKKVADEIRLAKLDLYRDVLREAKDD